MFDRFRTALDVKHARELLDVIKFVKKSRDLSAFIEHIKRIVGYRPPASRDCKRARKPTNRTRKT